MQRSSSAKLAAAIAAASIGALAAILIGCGEEPGRQGQKKSEVAVARPIRQSVVNWDNFVGRFNAVREVEVRARVSGFVEGVHFVDGQTVRAGQLLFTLDPRPAQAQLDIARSQYALAQADYSRARNLLADNAISKEDHDTRRAIMMQAAATQRARGLDLEFTRISAPIAGIPSYRRVDPGNLVAGGTSAGDVLTTIVALDPIYFIFDVSEAHFLNYHRAARSGRSPTVKIRLLDETGYRWTATLDFTDNAIDARSGTIRLRAVAANGRGFLRPGMLGHCRIESSGPYAALLVPDAAIVTDGDRRLVYVVAASDEVEAKAVLAR
jgi:RND family efflux transporter MFP subunit